MSGDLATVKTVASMAAVLSAMALICITIASPAQVSTRVVREDFNASMMIWATYSIEHGEQTYRTPFKDVLCGGLWIHSIVLDGMAVAAILSTFAAVALSWVKARRATGKECLTSRSFLITHFLAFGTTTTVFVMLLFLHFWQFCHVTPTFYDQGFVLTAGFYFFLLAPVFSTASLAVVGLHALDKLPTFVTSTDFASAATENTGDFVSLLFSASSLLVRVLFPDFTDENHFNVSWSEILVFSHKRCEVWYERLVGGGVGSMYSALFSIIGVTIGTFLLLSTRPSFQRLFFYGLQGALVALALATQLQIRCPPGRRRVK